MKDFIKRKVRLVLEMKTSHTPSNPATKINDPHTASDKNIEDTMFKITQYNNEYGQDPYFQNAHEGDGVYMATVHTNGNVTIKTPNQNVRQITDDKIGLLKTGNHGNKHVFIRACRGIEHPEFSGERNCNVRGKSPADDAAIKTYMIFGKEIIEYVRENMEGYDAYTADAEDKNFKEKTSDKWQYKYDKLEKEKQFKNKKRELSLDPDDASDVDKKQAMLKAKYDRLKQRRKS